jgi:methylenetetrahydrofolate reductase (NADPH)
MTGQPTDALLRGLFEAAPALPLTFELFPPKTQARRAELLETVVRLSTVEPAGFSVTMGAAGSTRAGTHATAREVMRVTETPVRAHITALGLGRDEIAETADALWADGITRVLALRGDPPRDRPLKGPPSYAHASDLVAALAARHDFDIAVAAYPEKHPEAASLEADIGHLKEKLDAGASKAICQFVLKPEAYGAFLEQCGRHGITAPIVPGVMPVTRWSRIRRFAEQNGTEVPGWIERLMGEAQETPELARLASLAITFEHMRRLIAYGAPALHVYTLNRWELPLALAHLMGRQAGKGLPAGFG